MVGTGLGAKKGILIKNSESLEKAHQITDIVFDKTGTLTKGTPTLTDIIPLVDISAEEILKIACIAENKSEHPMAQAILDAGKAANLQSKEAESFVAFPGKGIKSIVEGKKIIIGTQLFINEEKIPYSNCEEVINKLAEGSKTIIFVAEEKRVLGLLGVADIIRENAEKIVADLKKMKINIYLLTGDNKKTADSIAQKVQIENVFSEILPDKKAEMIENLKAKGKTIAMVGDGINDAPALATADISIALGHGTDIAIESAEIVLMKDDLQSIIDAIKLSKKTLQKIKQNLFWAFIYNILGIPIAACGFLNPIIAGAAMAFSSFSVVLNSLSLKRIKL
jgi:Cu+-exporting ATPase